MSVSNIVRAVVKPGSNYTVTSPIMKEDKGQILLISGLELPSVYEIDFSNERKHGTSITMLGNADGVLIPSQFIKTGRDVYAFYYYTGDGFGQTEHIFRLPNDYRPDRTDEVPEPEQQSSIDQLISVANEAIDTAQESASQASASAQSAGQSAISADESAQSASASLTALTEYGDQAIRELLRITDDVNESASQAHDSAEASAQSASDAETARQATTSLVAEAQGYANASAQSAQASAQSASQAHQFAQTASLEAESAQDYATQADISANTASNKAQEASTSAQTASTKATEASQSASQALTYKNDAESAKTASQTAQGKAEDAQTAAETAQGKAEDAQEAAETVAASIQSSASQIAQNTADIADLQTDVAQNEADILKAFPTDTASGAVASFTDGADGLPLKSLVVDINPVQDLHGQDAPYPAGGGKNKSSVNEINNIGWATANNDLLAVFNGLPNGTYTISITAVVKSISTSVVTSWQYGGVAINAAGNVNFQATVAGAPSVGNTKTYSKTFTIDDSNRGAFTALYVYGCGNNQLGEIGLSDLVNIQIESGNQATQFAPYSNICPISGWTGCEVQRAGKNLLSLVESEMVSSGWNRIFPISLKAGTYVMSCQNQFGATTAYGCQVTLADANNNAVKLLYSGYTFGDTVFVTNPVEITEEEAQRIKLIRFNLRASKVTFENIFVGNIQLELGSTATPYEPYTGRSITIDLGQTVYGGKLDVLSGELTIDMAMVDLGTLTWTYSGESLNHRFSALMPSDYLVPSSASDRANIVCSRYAPNPSVVASTSALGISGYQGSTTMFVRDLAYSDINSFKSAVNGEQLVYRLATPIEIQLSANQINSLYGVNNLWADSGDTEVEYIADTKAYIAKKIAEAISALS